MPKKDTYYFSHDANAHSDPKIIKLRRVHSWAGYGCFWLLIEKLREQPKNELPVTIIPDLAYDLRIDETLITAVINDFDLFVVTTEVFFSNRLKRSMQQFNESREKRSAAGKKGNDKRWSASQSDTIQSQSDTIQSQVKESKKNQNKTKERVSEVTHVPVAPISEPPNVFDNVFFLFKTLSAGKEGWDENKCKVKTERLIKEYQANFDKIDLNKMVQHWIDTEFKEKPFVYNKKYHDSLKDPKEWQQYHLKTKAAGYEAIQNTYDGTYTYRLPGQPMIDISAYKNIGKP